MTNQTAIDVGVQDAFNSHKRDIFLSMNCHAIGQITKFNSEDQTATVKINYSKKFRVADPSKEGLTKTVLREYPLLLDCPVVVITGGVAGLSMPIAAGDDCILLFNDRDIDNWFSGATSGALQSPRLHAMSDAIALVGVRSLKKSLSNYDSDNPVLFNGDTKITLTNEKIRLENSIETLNTILQDLILSINSIVTVGTAATQTVNPASQTALTAIGTRLEGLLE